MHKVEGLLKVNKPPLNRNRYIQLAEDQLSDSFSWRRQPVYKVRSQKVRCYNKKLNILIENAATLVHF